MELRHFRYFLKLAEELHFGRAAKRLGIAQPPLSKQIRQLEIELGFDLFHRTKRQVKLTPAGKVFLDEIKVAMAQVEQAIRKAERANRGEMSRLVVGFVEGVTYNGFLPYLVTEFRKQFPDVQIELQEMTSLMQAQALIEHRIDIGLVLMRPSDPTQIGIEHLWSDKLVIAMHRDHPLASRTEIDLAELGNEPFIIFPKHVSPVLYDRIIESFERVGFRPRFVQEAVQVPTVTSLVAAGVGVALVPESLSHLGRKDVALCPARDFVMRLNMEMIWREDDTNPVVSAFLDVARNFVRERELSSTAKTATSSL